MNVLLEAQRKTPATLPVVVKAGEVRVDSRQLATPLGVEHRSLFKLLTTYEADFAGISLVRFEIAAVKTPGGRGTKREHFAMLTEDQAYLLLTYTKNTAEARALKQRLVLTFKAAREGLQGRVFLNAAEWDLAMQVERDAAKSEEAGRIGGQLLRQRRDDKPRHKALIESLRVSMQIVLPWPKD